MAGPTLIARSRQSAWPLFVLAPASALLVWMTSQTWSPSFHAEAELLISTTFPPESGRPSSWVAPSYASGAPDCALAPPVATRRTDRRRPQRYVELFWGPGTLPWSAITHLTRQNNWLFVHGTRPDGRRRRLIVNLSQLDQEPSAILAAIQARR